MSATTNAQSVIDKLKKVWTRLSDNFRAFWSATEVENRLNLLRSTRDMLLERNKSAASKGPAEAETEIANRTRAFFYAACPELSDDKISRLASEIFPELISARVANVEECLRIDNMFVHTAVAAALPKGSPNIGAVEKQMLDTRQKNMYTFLLDVITVFSSANGALAPAPNEGASVQSQNQTQNQQQKLTQNLECEYEQKDTEAELEAETVAEGTGNHTISTISTPTHVAATTSRSDLSAPSNSTEGLALKPPRPPANSAAAASATTTDTTPASGSVPTVQTTSLSMATPLFPSSAVKSTHAVSTTDLRDTNAEALRVQWEAHGRAFEKFWRRLTIEKLPDGSDAHARAREEFLRVARRALLRRMAKGAGEGDPTVQQRVFYRLCPELRDDKLPRLCRGDVLPQLMVLRLREPDKCADHDRAFLSAGVNRSATTVAVDISNRQFFVHTFLAEVLSLFTGIETLTVDAHSNP